MEMSAMNDFITDNHGLTLPISAIDDRYSCYRLIYPKAEKLMVESIERYGQLTSVVVSEMQEGGYLMIDGFKRLRASRSLDRPSLQATILKAGERALKAAMLHLNRKTHSMTAMEEAIIVRALYREHKLTQVAIAALLGFHKSWVCRRLALIERLDAGVLDQVRLGLIGPGIIRELGKLPRGNQSAALDTIHKHQMTCRETAQLMVLLLERPRWGAESILWFPEPILSQREPDKPSPNTQLQRIIKKLSRINRLFTDLLQQVQAKSLSINPFEERSQVQKSFAGIEQALMAIKNLLLTPETPDVDF
jgi:ParB/RepB/Spo0J family partition protein